MLTVYGHTGNHRSVSGRRIARALPSWGPCGPLRLRLPSLLDDVVKPVDSSG